MNDAWGGWEVTQGLKPFAASADACERHWMPGKHLTFETAA